jgi:NhaA family Na+:H+ antiporter
MATDIAFAMGILALLGSRVPAQLRIFLLTLAIIDDLGAILVIAIFYTQQISFAALATAAFLILITLGLKSQRVQKIPIYILMGILTWFTFLLSGVHATIAGVIFGLLTPANGIDSVASYLLKKIHPWVLFLIVPLFAITNSGVSISNLAAETLVGSTIFQGVFWGLFLGKPLGIFLAVVLSLKLGRAQKSQELKLSHYFGAACLGGIGFTMALFISGLSFLNNPELEVYSKVGILSASLASAILGTLFLWMTLGNDQKSN